ncbi:FecR domain-containing protein [Gemmobacter fulvus]|uniref:FecR family protein n=1 Tax=Gemmobacter fulvus TaxID=2840474 RepID=UPI002796677C|nr:FecR domain-containing protein [Gemmobacter fulvus]MDQ1849680.1 FecR domain-containing protein [Gemmobacter fulvus]
MPIALTRRLLLASPALSVLPRRLWAAEPIGTTRSLTGTATLTRTGGAYPLHPDDPLTEGDMVATAADSLATLELFTQTQIHLGPDAQFTIDRFTADLGGVISIGGAMVFDRLDDLPPLDLTVQSAFAQIGVRGTRFFAGPSRGTYGVFVARGRVVVQAVGASRTLVAGEGVDIASAGAAPSAVARWGEARIAEAFAGLGLTP